ncbi:MAG TPA: ATP-binding protein [Streptosporangiaceae bacterium]|nr:ATP-binding protein [Streptosporangiaceae bacterium]
MQTPRPGTPRAELELAGENARIHSDNLELTLTRVWLALIGVFGGQWLWISAAEHASPVVQLTGIGFTGIQLIAITIAFRKRALVRPVVLAQLLISVAVALTLISLTGRGHLFDAGGALGPVADGLLLMLAPALSSYVGFGPALKLAAPCTVVISLALIMDQLSYPGQFRPEAIPNEQAIASIANLVVVWSVARFLRRGARQADILSEQAARFEARRRADEAATMADQQAVTLVHDLVLGGLGALTRPGSGDGQDPEAIRLVDHAVHALSGPVVPAQPDDADTELLAAVRAEISHWTAILPITFAASGSALVPSQIALAFAGALGECLRNVRDHARASAVIVSLSSEGFHRLQVRDNGLGFDTRAPAPGHYGIRNSIVGRMTAAGGTARVVSAPGAGTTVTLDWAPLRSPEIPEQVLAGSLPWSWVERLGLNLRYVWLTYFAPQLVATALFAIFHLGNSKEVPVALAVLTAQIMVSALAAKAAARLALSLIEAAALVAVTIALLWLGISVIVGGTQDGYAYWAAGGAVCVVATIALLRPLWESLLTTLLVIGTIDLSISHASSGGTIGANAVIVFGLLAAIAHRRAFAGLTPISDNYLARLSEARQVAERRRAIRSVEERRIDPVRQRVLPFLIAVRDAAAVAAAPEVAEVSLPAVASRLQQWTRQHLNAAEFSDERLLYLLDEANKAGITIEILGANPSGQAIDLGRKLVETALHSLKPAELKISFIPVSDDSSDLMLFGVSTTPITDAVLRQFTDLDRTLQVSAAGNLLVVKWAPAASRKSANVR